MRGGERRSAYRLARQLKRVDVAVMWTSLNQRQRAEWEVFNELEPDGDTKTEWGLARIVQYLARDPDKALSEFLLQFGDRQSTKPVQTVQHQERLLNAWIVGSNAQFKQGVKKVKK